MLSVLSKARKSLGKVVFALSALALAACTPTTTPTVQSGSGAVQVALLVPGGSGQASDELLARSLQNAARMAIGDLAGVKIDLRVYNTAGQPAQAKAMAEKAVEEGAQVILDGTVGALALAQRSGAHLHLVSSGAVYGARRLSMGPTQEAHITTGAPHPLERMSAYGNAKRMAEALVACASADYCISRPFAFLGPGLPLDQHFAAGNFVRDAAAGQSIIVQGDGTPVRSYMHPADLAAWLLALLASPLRGQAINIGSSQPVSIAALAAEIAAQAGGPAPRIMGSPADGADPSAYWPDTTLAQSHGLSLAIDRHSAIADMLQWARNAAPTNHPSSLLTTP